MKLELVGNYLAPTNGTLSVFPPWNLGTQWSLSIRVGTSQSKLSKLDQWVYFHLHRLPQVYPLTKIFNSQGGEYAMIWRLVSHRRFWEVIRNLMRIGALPKIVKKTRPRFHRGRKYILTSIMIILIIYRVCRDVNDNPMLTRTMFYDWSQAWTFFFL